MPEQLPKYDAWKLDNGPYENDGEPDEPEEEPSDGELYPDGTVVDPEAYGYQGEP